MPLGITIHPEAIYEERAVRRSLGLSETAMGRAKRSGELQFAKRGHNTYYRGAWLLRWLDEGSNRRSNI